MDPRWDEEFQKMIRGEPVSDEFMAYIYEHPEVQDEIEKAIDDAERKEQ